MASAIDYIKNTLSLHSNEVFYSTMAEAIVLPLTTGIKGGGLNWMIRLTGIQGEQM